MDAKDVFGQRKSIFLRKEQRHMDGVVKIFFRYRKSIPPIILESIQSEDEHSTVAISCFQLANHS